MGWLQMSKQELRRVEVLTEVLAGSRTTESAAGVLGVSLRQAQRLVARYRDGGGGALIHKSRGRPASNKLGSGVRELVLELVRQNYRDFGPTLAAEVLLERHGVEVSRETLRKWMVEAGVWLSRKQRRSFHQPRLRRESLGELVQIDGSEHRWFEEPWRALHVAGVHRRCHQQLDAAALRSEREHGLLLRSAARISCDPWMPGGLLLGQALGLPGQQAGRARAAPA